MSDMITDSMVEKALRAFYFQVNPDDTEGEYVDAREDGGDELAAGMRAALIAAFNHAEESKP